MPMTHLKAVITELAGTGDGSGPPASHLDVSMKAEKAVVVERSPNLVNPQDGSADSALPVQVETIRVSMRTRLAEKWTCDGDWALWKRYRSTDRIPPQFQTV